MGLAALPLQWLSPAGPRGRLAILAFHRVVVSADPLVPHDPDAVAFRRQMRWLRDFCRVMPLPEAVEALREGRLPARACSITFDDGYANNLEVALPILRELGLPATIFVAVEAVERGIMWNDLVIESLRATGGQLREADRRALGLAAGPVETAGAAGVLEALKYLPTEHRWEAAEELHRRATGRAPPRLMMTPEQVAQAARLGADIGAHTVAHVILKNQTAERARLEIESSRDWVAAVVGRRPAAFAYPNGRPGLDFDDSHAAAVRAAGFRAAVTTRWGCATAATDLYQLPRIAPWDRTRLRYWARLALLYARSYAG